MRKGTVERLVEVDMARLYARIEELGEVGRVSGGLWRWPLTPAEGEAVRRVGGWMEAAGLAVRRDNAGNLFGRIGPEGGPRVLVGSHLDSVKNGGVYDGALGVLSGLAAVEALREACGAPARAVEVVAWTGEEGNRFPGFLGSRGFCGMLGEADLDRRDEDGVSLRDALAAAGFDPDGLPNRPPDDVAAYLELHVEQGRVLEQRAGPVGVVEAIAGLRQFQVAVTGSADHAGTTPMDLRHDALRAGAEILLDATRRVEAAGAPAVVTCGRMELRPGAVNVVPGEARFTLDLRDADADRLERLTGEIRAAAGRLSAAAGCAVDWSVYHDTPPVRCDAQLVDLVDAAARSLGYEPLRLVSGAGHDAAVLASAAPSAMIFVPSRDGRSHCPEEYTSPEAAAPGVGVLAEALRRLAW